MNLSTIRGVVMDMDGVVWRGDEMLPGASALFDFLQARGLPFAVASNNSSKAPADYIAKMEKMGIGGVTEKQVVTSGTATVAYLRAHYPARTAVHVIGGDGLRAMVSGAGFEVTDAASIVVVGIDTQLTYDKLKKAARLIWQGADFIGTNDDANIPLADGLAPGAGSIIASLKTATGREPLVIGKPGKPMFEAALHTIGTLPETTLMIGDRLNTDIQGAQGAGLKTALVLTGVSTRQDMENGVVKPDGVYDDLYALLAAWG